MCVKPWAITTPPSPPPPNAHTPGKEKVKVPNVEHCSPQHVCAGPSRPPGRPAVDGHVPFCVGATKTQ